ncbi:hypothetical protein [Austwickia sp. TVS 96-490-7B]|nr:hypothetical protein [Austwickia sp. TVS 96-490-7B]
MRANPRNISFAELSKVCETYVGFILSTVGSIALFVVMAVMTALLPR